RGPNVERRPGSGSVFADSAAPEHFQDRDSVSRMDIPNCEECADRSFSEEPAGSAVRTGDGAGGGARRSRAATAGIGTAAPGADGTAGRKARTAGALPFSGTAVRERGAPRGFRSVHPEGKH